jgi:NCAIR mutase (PurE)-related protein
MNNPTTDNVKPNPARPMPELEQWLAEARAGQRSWSELAERLLMLEHSSTDNHRPDFDRQRRCGFGEVIFGSGKSASDIVQIASRLLDRGQVEVLATRVEMSIAQEVASSFPHSRYDALGKTLRLAGSPIRTCAAPPSLPRWKALTQSGPPLLA